MRLAGVGVAAGEEQVDGLCRGPRRGMEGPEVHELTGRVAGFLGKLALGRLDRLLARVDGACRQLDLNAARGRPELADEHGAGVRSLADDG